MSDNADRPALESSSKPPHPGVRKRRRARDFDGRPRDARLLDVLGRSPAREATGVAAMPDDLNLTPNETLRTAQQLLDQRRPFHAHEVLEATWRCAPQHERELRRGTAPLTVGLAHAHRGNAVGGIQLLQRSAGRIGAHTVDRPHGIDIPVLKQWVKSLTGRLPQEGIYGSGARALIPRLATVPQEPSTASGSDDH
jgi:hypothetical protein